MKTPIFFILSVLLLGASFSNASSFLGKAPESGLIISVNPEKIPSKSGESVLISGTIKYVKKSQANKGKEDKEDKSGGSDKKHGLLEEFKAQGIDIVGTFPSSAVDISSELTLESVSNQEIRFSYPSKSIVADDLNQFTLKVYNNHTNKGALKKLSVIQAKLERRLQLLANLKKKFESGKATQDAIAAIEKEIAKLSAITTKIAHKLNANENLMAENTYAIQVDNLTSNYSKLSTVMNNFRFLINSDIGSVIQGMKINLKSQIVSLSPAKEDHDDDDDGYLAECYFNNQRISSQKISGPRKSVNIVIDYPSEKLNPANENIFSVTLYHLEDGVKGRRIGYLNYKVPVIADTVKPTWLSDSIPNHQDRYTQQLRPISLKAQDSFGRIDPATFKLLLSGQSTTNDLSQTISSAKFDDGAMYEFTGDLNPLDEGEYTLTAKISDLATNVADDFNVVFRIDRTAPVTTTTLATNTLTNKTSIEVPISVSDLSPTATDVYVNNGLAMTSGLKEFTANVNLNIEGNNTIRIESKDAAGNVALSQEIIVLRDTTPPVLTLTTPKENDYVNGDFDISVLSNEEISVASVNGQPLKISPDKRTLQTVYTSLVEGNISLDITAVDMAGNTAYLSKNVKVILKALNPSLVGLYLDESTGGKVLIRGAVGSTRPYLEVSATGGFFNSQTVTASKNGEFLIKLDVADSFVVSVYDSIAKETIRHEINYNTTQPYFLAGTVYGIDNKPLINAKVSIVGTNLSVYTNSSGVFEFPAQEKRISGDQTVVIDGSTVFIQNGENIKYAQTSIAVTLGVLQRNIIQKPIYLVPNYLDTGTSVTVAAGGIVEDPHAPGVQLKIEPNSVKFPGNVPEDKISIVEIPAEMATVPVPRGLKPNTVFALEPSGVTFSKRAEITLPNSNAFPAGTDMIVYLMNSKTGRWEVGGVSKVAADGQSVVSKLDQGISHFSQAFASIQAPEVRPVGAQDKAGADTMNGSVSTVISMPKSKVMGQDIAPSLIYKSTWAKPSILVSNIFNFPKTNIELKNSYETGVKNSESPIIQTFCYWADLGTREECKDYEIYQRNVQYFNAIEDAKAKIEPEFVEATFQVANVKTDTYKFTNLPQSAYLSFFVNAREEKDSSGNPLSEFKYLPSGIYPYTTDYKAQFKTILVEGRVRGYQIGTLAYREKGTNDDFQYSHSAQFYDQDINQIAEKDRTQVSTSDSSVQNVVVIQNKIKSEAGQGWKVASFQKILNPTDIRIGIEESSGEVSSYFPQNTIETLIDGDLHNLDLTNGVALNEYPTVYTYEKTNKFNIYKLNVQTPQNVNKTLHAALSKYSGGMKSEEYRNYAKRHCSGRPRRCSWKNSSVCFTDAYTYEFLRKPSQMLSAQDNVYSLDGVYNSLDATQPGLSTLVLGAAEKAYEVGLYYYTAREEVGQSNSPVASPIRGMMQAYCANTPGINCSGITWSEYRDLSHGGYYSCGAAHNSLTYGLRPVTTNFYNSNFALNNPKGINPGIKPDEVIIADYGNHRVLAINVKTKAARRLAGNDEPKTAGDGEIATSASIYHPQGVAYDLYGNLYISLEAGVIKKVDAFGVMSSLTGYDAGQVGFAASLSLRNPNGLVVDTVNNVLYVADTGNNRIVSIDLKDNHYQVVAGNGAATSSGDGGPALNAGLASPMYVSLDTNNNLIFNEAGSNKIRRVNLSFNRGQYLTYISGNNDNSYLTKFPDGKFARVYRSGARVYFNEKGFQTSAIDLVNNTTYLTYDSEDKLTAVTYPTGQTEGYTYSQGLLSEIKDVAGRVTSFQYRNGQLSKVINPDGSEKNYVYTDDGLLTEEYNERNAKTQYVYNSQERLLKVIRPDLSEINLTDAASSNVSSTAVGTIANADNTVTDASGNTIKMEKDFMGYLYTITDPEGRVTKMIRDEKGRTIKVERSDKTTAEFIYDTTYGDLIKAVDTATGDSVETRYDRFGHEIWKKDSRGKVTQNIYNPTTGLLDRTILPDLTEIVFTYDRGLLVKKSIAHASGTIADQYYQRNPNGNVIKHISAGNKSVSYELDLAGNVTKSTSEKEPGVFVNTVFAYDSMNRLVSVTSPNNTSSEPEKTSYTYSKTGQLESIIDPQNNSTIYNYNVMDQLVEKIDPEGFSTVMTYYDSGNVKTQTDPNGNVTSYTYTKTNKIDTVQLPDDFISYEYNDKQQVKRIRNTRSDVHYQYDVKSRVNYASIVGIGELTGYPLVEQSLDFDANDNVTNSSLAINSTSIESIAMTYDDLNRLGSMNSTSFGAVAFDFDKLSRLTGMNLGNISYSNSFNARHELSGIKYLKNSDSSTIQEFGFSYDERNYITQKRMLSSVASEGLPETRSLQQTQVGYSYDKNGQLTGASSLEDISLNESFSYDPLGNRLTDKSGNYVYDTQKQRLKEDGQYLYLYDNNGNILYKNSKDSAKFSYQYEYSSTNQLKLVRVLQKTVSSPLGEVIKEISYKYDVLGRRLRKDVVDHQNTSDITKNYKINYIYRGENIAVELDANDNVVIAKHLHSPLKSDDILKSSYTDRAKELGFVKNSGVITYIKDHLGTVTELVDNNGNTKQRYNYSSYGILRSISSGDGSQDITLTPEVKPYFTYTGREWDSEVGLYYYRARYYDASTGRFLQKDPDPGKLADPRTFLSKYTYGADNPIMFTDPTGRTSFWGWKLAVTFPALSLIVMNTTDFFQKNFDFTSGDIKSFNYVALTVAIIGAAVLTGGAAGSAFGGGLLGVFAGATVGAVTGAVIGSVGFPALGLGDSQEGARYGAVVGGIAGAAASPMAQNYFYEQWRLASADPIHYFFDLGYEKDPLFGLPNLLLGGGFSGPSLGGTLVYSGIILIADRPK